MNNTMRTVEYDMAKVYPTPLWFSVNKRDFDADLALLADEMLDCLTRANRLNRALKLDEAKIRLLIGMLMQARRASTDQRVDVDVAVDPVASA